jgi:hypothetical protein
MNKEIRHGLAWAGGMIALALGATFARKLGYIDGDTVTRVVFGMIGFMIASYGNRMPKAVVPDAYARQATRVGGWAFVMSGLVYAGLWAFAPIKVAVVIGCGALVLGMAVMIGYAYWLRAEAKAV